MISAQNIRRVSGPGNRDSSRGDPLPAVNFLLQYRLTNNKTNTNTDTLSHTNRNSNPNPQKPVGNTVPLKSEVVFPSGKLGILRAPQLLTWKCKLGTFWAQRNAALVLFNSRHPHDIIMTSTLLPGADPHGSSPVYQDGINYQKLVMYVLILFDLCMLVVVRTSRQSTVHSLLFIKLCWVSTSSSTLAWRRSWTPVSTQKVISRFLLKLVHKNKTKNIS